MQIKTFSIPVHDDGLLGEAMNRFLRGHQLLRVHRERRAAAQPFPPE